MRSDGRLWRGKSNFILVFFPVPHFRAIICLSVLHQIVSNMDIQWKCSFDNVDHRKHLEDLLPPDYRYQVTKFKVVQDPENPNPPLMETQFEARVYANVCQTS